MTRDIYDGPFLELEPATLGTLSAAAIADVVKTTMAAYPDLTMDEATDMVMEGVARDLATECWQSDQYTVVVTRGAKVNDGWPPMDWLSIRRRDREPIRDWRHMQAIKTQLCGAEREGVELYPKESRLVDMANQFHMWVFVDDLIFPFGFNDGRRVDDTMKGDVAGKQRALN
jgi:hypothetical protein